MARHGDDVLGPEHGRLLEDAAPHFGERQAIGGGIEASSRPAACTGWNVTPRTHGCCQREVDDLADLAVVHALLDGHDERRRDAVPVEPLERLLADRGADRRRAGPSARRARTNRTAGRPRSPACSSASRAANSSLSAMRMPLVLTIRCRIGRAFARSSIAKKSGWIVGSPPEICTTSGWPSLRDDGVEHALDLVERRGTRGRSGPLDA